MKIPGNIRNMRRALVALAIAFPVLYLVFAIAAVVLDYRATMARAESDVSNISATLSEHAMRTIGEVDGWLQTAITEIERRALSIPGPDERAIHDILAQNVRKLPQAFSMHAVDARGWVRASGTVYPLAPFDVRDREYYRYHLGHPDSGLYISRPIRARESGRWVIPVNRRINNPDGSLKMIVTFGIDMAYFDRFYRTLKLGERGQLLLVRSDGWVLMASPLREDILAMNLANAPLFAHLRQRRAGAYRVEHSVIDNRSLIIGYAASTQYPLVATAGMAQDYVLTQWHGRIRQIATIGIFSIALLEALIMLLWRRLNDLVSAQDSLERQNDALVSSKRRYQELVDGIDGIVWELELPGFRFTYVSGNAAAISGYPAEEWLSNPRFWQERLSDTADGRHAELALTAGSHTTALQPIEHRVRTPDDREIWLRSNVMAVATSKDVIRLRGVTVDITRQKTSESQLFQMTHFDQLTHLPNRHALVGHIEHALSVAERKQARVAVMLIDLDNFKTINDSLGHEQGDKVLCTMARRIQGCLRVGDLVARIGGDEFVVLMEDVDSSIVGVEQLAERITCLSSEVISVDGHELYVELSIGISLFPQDGKDCQTLMRHAETALYRAKAAGRNSWHFFDESMARQVARRLEIETALRRAIENKEFLLYFQPQYSLRENRIIGVETLLRWSRPNIGIVPPLEFLTLAEESAQIVPIGAWILQSACEQAVAWRRERDLSLRVAVNVAAKQIHHKNFVDQVRRTLDDTGFSPHMLELEITESSILENIDDTVDKLHQLKALGIAVAVDDFGTGYSSLAYLKQLPIDRLKIDQAFVRDIPGDPDDCAIVRTIIAMARNLGLSVIAEGVETQDQVEFLNDEACDEIQGYLLSRPVAAEELLAFLKSKAPADQ